MSYILIRTKYVKIACTLPLIVYRLIKSKHACGQRYARMSKYVTREKSSSVLLSPFPKVALKITCAAKATKRKIVKLMARWSERIALDIRGVDSLLGSAERDVFLLDGWVPRTAEAFRRGLMRGGEESEQENGKKRSGCVDENTAVREREVRMVAGSSGGIQIHVDAAQSGVHHFSTHSHPSCPPLRPISYHPPPFDTGSGVPIDLDRLKTRRNHRRQLLRTPLSGMSCGRIGVGEILAREAFCRVDVEWCLKQRSITKSRSGRKMWRRLRVTACNELNCEIDPVCRR